MLAALLEHGEARVENQYARSVRREGNPAARAVMDEAFEVTDRKWRGIGPIPASGLRLRLRNECETPLGKFCIYLFRNYRGICCLCCNKYLHIPVQTSF